MSAAINLDHETALITGGGTGLGMLERWHRNILFTAFLASRFGIPLVTACSAAKSASVGLVRSLATEISGQWFRSNAIAPGWIDSDMMCPALAGNLSRCDKIFSRTLVNRFDQTNDVGNATIYLHSPAAEFVTGTVLPLDGGVSLGF